MRWLLRPFAFLWELARASRSQISPDLRAGSGASAITIFFFLVFFVVGAILMVLGVDLDDADRWIDAQTGWLDWIGSRLFNLLGFVILLLSVVVFGGGLWQRLFGGDAPQSGEEDGRLGLGCILFAPVAGWFGWVMMTG
jgi:hypothetical protein